MKNYAGHRMSPWLGHLMVSRQETARPLLTPGEIMQLPADDELVLVSGCPPIRAKKARYFEDERFRERIVNPAKRLSAADIHDIPRDDDWKALSASAKSAPKPAGIAQPHTSELGSDQANSGIRREPELPRHEEIVPAPKPEKAEFEFVEEDTDDEVQRANSLRGQGIAVARQAAMDPDDDLGL